MPKVLLILTSMTEKHIFFGPSLSHSLIPVCCVQAVVRCLSHWVRLPLFILYTRFDLHLIPHYIIYIMPLRHTLIPFFLFFSFYIYDLLTAGSAPQHEGDFLQ